MLSDHTCNSIMHAHCAYYMIFLENISVWSIQEVLSIIKVDFLHEKKQDILGIQLFALNAHKISIIHPFFQKFLNTPKFQNSYLHSQFSDKRKQLLVQTFSVFFSHEVEYKKIRNVVKYGGEKKISVRISNTVHISLLKKFFSSDKELKVSLCLSVRHKYVQSTQSSSFWLIS